MNILDALCGEHGTLRHQLEAYRLVAPRFGREELAAATFLLAEAIENHASLEDELVFETLARSPDMPRGPVEAMRSEHQQIDALLAQLVSPVGNGDESPQPTVQRLVETVRHHFGHEENALFPLARRLLPAAQLEELGARWARVRGVSVASLPLAGEQILRQPHEVVLGDDADQSVAVEHR